ncbi:TPA: AAA family ATPase [Proteus mirabilis]|uniref:AAA family ATPase n=1 Tax=Proteus genomosp. 6 TaxID=1311820 RepID=A0ABV1L8P1_9GAMM|nr:AAA family ATPase [Providencia thailandensis]ELB1213538.1 AAA family ATPase [Proteus mirabilis]MBG3042298.1 AAA family ATPase [Proteus mirabilis]MBG3153181.1 AAA family ATPase [Proteus mirabilis]MBI6239096.1 AAA family ATPase [Proteus mirabilis]MCL8327062.1 AAA family ATPase [Providencia thailandensis]
MSGRITKINTIKKMAVFQDFQWSSSVRDDGNNIAEFKNINIIYGRNYSGKTTLSRAFRALETGIISDKYDSAEFQFSFDTNNIITQDTLLNHGQIIRVFNEDFIKENLRFIVDDEQTINSFAILGENNAKIEEEIRKNEEELGNEDDKSGLISILLDADNKVKEADKIHSKRSIDLEDKLRNKANQSGTGIKHNKIFGDANYNVSKIKTDILTISKNTYSPISGDKVSKLQDLLREVPKPTIPESPPLDLQYSIIESEAKKLVEKKIQTSETIQELLNNAILASWVRTGRELHKYKQEKCAFCGNILPEDLLQKIDKHFNKESEELHESLNILLSTIEKELLKIPNLLKIKTIDFYSNFANDLNTLNDDLSKLSIDYSKSLSLIKEQIEKRKSDIFTPLEFHSSVSVEDSINELRYSYEKIRSKSNDFTKSLNTEQVKARNELRLHEVYKFITDIKYVDERNTINKLLKEKEDLEKTSINIKQNVDEKRKKINELKGKLKDESKGADRVNDYLNNFFGHQYLSLKAIEEKLDGKISQYRFEVTRNNKKAFHLSEGECSLIAFCYFMAKLEDVETKGNQPIIWIDDPICSLDANHIFFIYSLINAKIVTDEQYNDGEELKTRPRFKQLFISTHNLDFLKYLKRLPGALNRNKSQYFIINRTEQKSTITLMPRYLKDYVTEFNFLFHQIYKCANAQVVNDENHDCYYNFGNNARKFLEAFLYYKYPNAMEKDDKLSRFFGDDALAASLTDRINNEFSHLAGVFERSISPIDVPEMKITAKFILKKIEEKDPDQYSALLQSIGQQDNS